ncbi:MAG: hypothetical protein F4185_08500 [Chloroflexi bacterium]|nr:hypothetical protein [Chloroflexota bacterium]
MVRPYLLGKALQVAVGVVAEAFVAQQIVRRNHPRTLRAHDTLAHDRFLVSILRGVEVPVRGVGHQVVANGGRPERREPLLGRPDDTGTGDGLHEAYVLLVHASIIVRGSPCWDASGMSFRA